MGKTFNLKQMAKTMNFLSEHGFASPEEVDTALEAAISGQHAAGEKLKELESRITANKELMHQISVYRRTKPAHDGLKTAKKPERYREAFHADLTLYEAAVRYFRQQGLKKLPAVSKLQAENEALISEKTGFTPSTGSRKPEPPSCKRSNPTLPPCSGRNGQKRCVGIGSGKGVPFCSTPTRKGGSILDTPLLWEIDH